MLIVCQPQLGQQLLQLLFIFGSPKPSVPGLVYFGPRSHSIEGDENSLLRVHLLNDLAHVVHYTGVDILEGQGVKLVFQEALVVSEASVDHPIKVEVEVIDGRHEALGVREVDANLGIAIAEPISDGVYQR